MNECLQIVRNVIKIQKKEELTLVFWILIWVHAWILDLFYCFKVVEKDENTMCNVELYDFYELPCYLCLYSDLYV